MVKEHVFALAANDAERERVQAIYTMAERTKKGGCVFDNLATDEEVIAAIKSRTEAYAKKLQKAETNPKADKRTENSAILKEVKKARAVKVTDEEIISAIKGLYKEKHNEKLQIQIQKMKDELTKLEDQLI